MEENLVIIVVAVYFWRMNGSSTLNQISVIHSYLNETKKKMDKEFHNFHIFTTKRKKKKKTTLLTLSCFVSFLFSFAVCRHYKTQDTVWQESLLGSLPSFFFVSFLGSALSTSFGSLSFRNNTNCVMKSDVVLLLGTSYLLVS